MHGSLEDHFLVIRIPWLNKVMTYLLLFKHDGDFGAISVSGRSCAAPVMRVHRPYWISFCRHSVDKAYMKHLSYQQESPLLVIKVYLTLTF